MSTAGINNHEDDWFRQSWLHSGLIMGSAENRHPSQDGEKIRSRYRTLNDTALMAALRREEPQAFVEFIERYQPVLTRYARDLRIQPAERSDWVAELLEDVALTLLRPESAVPDSLAAYLVRACRNKAYLEHRAQTRRQRYERMASAETDDAKSSDGESESDRPASTDQTNALFRFAAVLGERLDGDERELLDWSAACVPLRIIAEWKGLTRSAAAQRIWRLRRRMQDLAPKLLKNFSSEEQQEIMRFFRRSQGGSKE